MKKLFTAAGTAAALSLLSTSSVFAQAVGPNEITIAVTAPSTVVGPGVSIGTVIGFVVGAAVVFGIIAALIFVVIGAFQWITSGGDKGKVESARNHIVAAIVGLIVIVLSIVVVNFALQILGIGSLTNLRVPTLPH